MAANHEGQPAPAEQISSPYIRGMVLPADDRETVRHADLLPGGLEDRQEIVGGDIQAIDLDEPGGRLYVNEYGQHLELPMNRRATLLLWLYNPAHRYHSVLVGDALLVGPARGENDSAVPDDYQKILDARHSRSSYGYRAKTSGSIILSSSLTGTPRPTMHSGGATR